MMNAMNAWRERYYHKLAEAVSGGSMCWRAFTSAVIVKAGEVVVACHNHVAEGWPDCHEQMLCECKYHGKPVSECPFVPAEKQAIQQATKLGISLQDAVLYRCVSEDAPLQVDEKVLKQAGVGRIVNLNAPSDEEDEEEAGGLELRVIFDEDKLQAHGLNATSILQEADQYLRSDIVEQSKESRGGWAGAETYAMRSDGSIFMDGPNCLYLYSGIWNFFDEHEGYGACVKSIPSVIEDEESDAWAVYKNVEIHGL